MTFLLDTNVFIRARIENPMDLWPTLWSRLEEVVRDGGFRSIDRVRMELSRMDDPLSRWFADRDFKDFFLPVDSDVLAQYARVQSWARSVPVYSESALRDFAKVADSFLVATAAAKGMTVLTNEKSAPESKRRVKIPDACRALGVDCCDLNAAFRVLGVTV